MIQLERDEAGDLWLRGLSPLYADTLMRIPEWLESDDPKVRSRLLPPAYSDPDEEEQWRKFGAPELEHLFASRSRVITKDLATMDLDGSVTFRLCIKKAHENAWLSSLNAARLALFVLHDLQPEDMDQDPSKLGDLDKEIATVRIHVMALLQELLMEAEAPPSNGHPSAGEQKED